MRNLKNAAEGLRKSVVKSSSEMLRLMSEYELVGLEVLKAPTRADMSAWLASDRPRRRAAVPPSPGADFTQSTDASNLSQLTGEAILSDDYTGSDVSHVGNESMEERSVNTETGLMNTQWTDETLSPEEKQRKKKERKERKEKKKERENAKKEKRQEKDQDESDASGNSTQY